LSYFIPEAASDPTLHTLLSQVNAMKLIQSIVLAPNPNPQQIRDYFLALAINTPWALFAPDSSLMTGKLAQAGTSGVPILLDILPQNIAFDTLAARPFLATNLTREHLPQFRQALERDMALASVAREKQWDADVRDVVLKALPDHRLAFNADALIIAAEARDPATYNELTWRFVHLSGNHVQVEPFLKQCPGFDLEGASGQARRYAAIQSQSY
jgi:hypothetical protein